MKIIPFNLNNHIRVKVTPYGESIWNKAYLDCGANPPPPRRDADGWVKIQLPVAMEIWGPVIRMGGQLPLNTIIEIIVEE